MKRIIYIVLIFTFTFNLKANNDLLLKEARILYYNSTKDEKSIEKAIEKFNQIKNKDSKLTGVATTYIGSLTAVKAKFAAMPTTKYSLAIDGLAQMKIGLNQNPENIESLFVYGSTCFNLPFFFGKAKEAEETLKKIIYLIELNYKEYDKDIIINSLNFISDNVNLNAIEKEKLDALKAKMKSIN